MLAYCLLSTSVCGLFIVLLSLTKADMPLTTEKAANTDLASVLRRLETVTAEEAARKHAALREVRDAFVFRPPSLQSPSAADFILNEACEAARHLGSSGGEATRVAPVEGGDHARCLLG